MLIIDLPPGDEEIIRQAALLLVEGFKEHWPESWSDLESALEEMQEALEPGRIARIAVDDDGKLLGWVSAISQYRGKTWELHPLVVHPDYRSRGIGRALVTDIEDRVRERGGVTIYLGSDDEDNMTTLSNKDLYPNVVEHILNIEDLRGHPYRFYQKLGYAIVGVIPDANGLGKPDIIMAKRVATTLRGA